MNENKPPRKRYGVLVRTMLSPHDLAELTRQAKQEGKSRSKFVTRLLRERINQTNEETQ